MGREKVTFFSGPYLDTFHAVYLPHYHLQRVTDNDVLPV